MFVIEKSLSNIKCTRKFIFAPPSPTTFRQNQPSSLNFATPHYLYVPHSLLIHVTPVPTPLVNLVIPQRMANIFDPIRIPIVLHDLPLGYFTRIRKFYGERGYSTEKHLGWFLDWVELEEVDHDDVKVELFSQALVGEVKKWYKNLVDDSIMSYQSFKDALKDKWANQKYPKQYLFEYHSIRRKESDFIQEFSDTFMKKYNSIPTQFKPPLGSPNSSTQNLSMVNSPYD